MWQLRDRDRDSESKTDKAKGSPLCFQHIFRGLAKWKWALRKFCTRIFYCFRFYFLGVYVGKLQLGRSKVAKKKTMEEGQKVAMCQLINLIQSKLLH